MKVEVKNRETGEVIDTFPNAIRYDNARVVSQAGKGTVTTIYGDDVIIKEVVDD